MKIVTRCLWKNILLQLMLLFVFFGFSGRAAAQQGYQDLVFPPLHFTPPEVERYTLENGMQLFFVQDHELPMISMYAMIRTGDMYEPEEKLGLATITSEVIRTGGTTSRTSDEINELLEFLAASVEVDVEDEMGTAELWTLKKNLETSLELFVDILRHPAFEEDKVELALSQMLEMIRRRNDSPESIRSREFARILYGKMHPLARIPQVETIQHITRDDLAAFHQSYFHPNNIMLAVTGDFESGEMFETLKSVFGDWEQGTVDLPEVETVEYAFSPEVYLIDKDVEQTNLAIGHLGIKADNPDYPAIRVLDLILGSSGFSSRLFQKVRTERGLAYSVGSYLGAGTRDYGEFLIYCGTRNDAVAEAIQVILDEVGAFLETEVSERELEAAKNQYLNSYVFKFATVDNIVRRQMYYEYVGYPADFLETFRESVMTVTKDDVQRVANTYLHPDKMKILAVGRSSEIKEALASFGEVLEFVLDPVE